jgi:hypothetical protein
MNELKFHLLTENGRKIAEIDMPDLPACAEVCFHLGFAPGLALRDLQARYPGIIFRTIPKPAKKVTP